MQKGLLDLHSVMRWLIILFALLTLIKGLGGMNGKKPFAKGDKRTALFLMISCDIQLLLGFILYFMNGWWSVLTGGSAMASNYNRFFAVEHAVGMLVAIVLVHIGYSATKKDIADGAKFKRLFWYTLVAMIIIMATIPWPGREVARPLLPGMSA
jgi:hypothetical protein